MIIKQTQGKDIYAVLAYALDESHAPEIIDGSIAGETLAEISQDFLATLRLKPNIKKPVLHAAFSFEHGEEVSDATMSELGDAFLQRMGWNLDLTQRIYIRHYDHENEGGHPHFHLIASRIQFDKTLVSDSWNYYRGKQICRELEAEFGLETAGAPRKLFREPTRWEGLVYEQSGVLSVKMELQRRIFEATQSVVQTTNQMGELINQLTTSGIKVLPWRNPETKEIDGVSYRLGEFVMRGQALGPAFTWAGLQHYLGINYDNQRDAPQLQRAEQSELEHIRQRLESQWGPVEFPTHRLTKRCASPERVAIEAGSLTDRSDRRAEFIQHNFQLLATGLGVELRRPTIERTDEAPLTNGARIPDTADTNERTTQLPAIRFDLIDLGAIRKKAEALGNGDRAVALDVPGNAGSVAVNGRDGEGSTIYAGTLELRDRLAALLRGGKELSKPANYSDPAGTPDGTQRIGQDLDSNRGSAATGDSGANHSPNSQRAVDLDPRTLGTGDSGNQAQPEPLSIADQIRQRIEQVTGYAGNSSSFGPISDGGTQRPDRTERQPTTGDHPPTPDGGNRNAESQPQQPLSIADQIRQRIGQVTGYTGASTGDTGSRGDRGTQSADPNGANPGPIEWGAGAGSRAADQGRAATGDGSIDSAGDLPERTGTTLNEDGRSLGDRPATPTVQRSGGSPHEAGGIPQTPGELSSTVARQIDPGDEELRGADYERAPDQPEPTVTPDGNRPVEQAGDRLDQADERDEPEFAGLGGNGQDFEQADDEEDADERRRRRIQLEYGLDESGWNHPGRGSDYVQLRQPLRQEVTPSPTSGTDTDDARTVATYAELYARYNPCSGDLVADDFAIATTALSQQFSQTDVACILTTSPLVQAHKENLAGVQAYIERIIEDADQYRQQESQWVRE